VDRHLVRRASSGCEDWSCAGAEDESLVSTGALRERFARSVSWMPGAEGAPVGKDVDEGVAFVGTIRRDFWTCLLAEAAVAAAVGHSPCCC
jgi:hypothetical protein